MQMTYYTRELEHFIYYLEFGSASAHGFPLSWEALD